jgi:O-antigen/teichoic acid export membrane protein
MDMAMKFLGFLATAYLARVLGKSGFGAVNVGQSVLNYATVLSTGGLLILGTRKVAANHGSKLIAGEIFYGRLTLSIVVFLIAAAVTFIVSGFSEISFIILAFILCLFPTAFSMDWFFVGMQKMERVAYARILGTAVYLLIIVAIINERNDAILTGVAYTLGSVVTALLFIYFYKKEKYSFYLDKGRKNFLKTLKESFPLGIASYISQFLTAFPVIYIAFIAGNSQAGVFSAALKMIGLFLMFDRIFVTIFFPKITNVISTKESSLEEIFNTVLKINVFITLSASVLLFLFSEFIIIRTFGNEYSEAIFIFRLLLVYFAFTIIDSVFANTLIGLMKEKVYTLSLLFALIIFLIMTFILTPYIGEYGVIYSFMVINIISLSYMIFFIKRDIKIKVTRLIIVPILFAGVVFLFLALFKASFYIEILFAAFIFIPLLSIILGMGKEEINFIKRIFI